MISLAQDLNPGWRIVNEHHLEREFTFPDFREALAFTNDVGELAESQGHHPDIYLAWGKVKLAIQRFDALIAKDSTKALPRVYKAEALMKQGNYGSAEGLLQKVLAMDPDMAQAHVDLGDIRPIET